MHVAGWASREPRRRGDVTGRQRAARSPGRWSWRLVAWSVFVACLVVGSPFPSAGHAGERPLARAQWATTTQSLSPAEALDLDFRAMSGDTLNLGPFQGDIWLRLWLDGSEMGERRWLSVRWPYARDFRFYLVGSRSADGKPSLLEWREGAHPIGLPAIPTDPGRLLPAFDGKRQFLLRLSADGPTAMQLTLDSVQTERNRLLSRYLLFGIYLGAMLGMATYSLFLMLALRERTYAGYAAFLAATVLYVGLRYNVLGPLLPEFLHWMSPARQAQLAVALMALSGIGFVRRFLQSPRDDPRADRVLQLLMLLALSTVPASAALSGELSSLLVMGMVVATVLGIFWAAWRSMGRGFRPAFNLLISWSMFAVVVLLYLAMLLGVLPYSAVLTLGLPLGSLALALLLAFALGSRIRHKQREEAALERDRDRYRFLSERDGLTGLYNRRALDRQIEQAVDVALRDGSPLSLVVIDNDHFKGYNDRYGHLAGDDALRCLARTMAANVRQDDLCFRYGGEEFVILLPGQTTVQAMAVAERIREAYRTGSASDSGPGGTISLGVAELRPGDTATSLLARGDAALYHAKEQGRDRVEQAPWALPETPPG